MAEEGKDVEYQRWVNIEGETRDMLLLYGFLQNNQLQCQAAFLYCISPVCPRDLPASAIQSLPPQKLSDPPMPLQLIEFKACCTVPAEKLGELEALGGVSPEPARND